MKMPVKIDTEMLAPCGMNCLVCYKHCHTKKTHQPCQGCLLESKGKPQHCRKCKIKECVKEKSLSYCFECSDFPCRLIKNLEKSYNQRYCESLVENSRIAKEQGIPHLMETQIQKYGCSDCDGIISLHDTVCTECGKTRMNDADQAVQICSDSDKE
ncbi:hypothetical protein Trebr_0145 [Treponema brennaborense DSM 12168]|uniref:DUF3795 domain-containing protein n=2 Tax=Treponema TaxID=157 RepID=F4LLC0_TREBD|nr:hypothetical protein Trebr_0145 [Treponema brennaborense DSM 12168]